MTADLTAPEFTNEEAAIACVEASRWPTEATCPHCGSVNVHRMAGKTQAGYFMCNDCRDKFTCRTGTVMERSHIPVHKWLLAIHLMASSKKGMSAHQLHRMLGVTYKSAWFLSHRIREAMRAGSLTPMGGLGKTVEMDETYVGGLERNKHRSKRALRPVQWGGMGKEPVITLVERGGAARSFHVPEVTSKNVGTIVEAQLKSSGKLYTDDSHIYRSMKPRLRPTATVMHSAKEYVRGPVHTNTVEGYFSILKRGINGVYHHVSQQHLKRYLAEFDFRYSNRMALGINDKMRAELLLKGIEGKRLTYRRPDEQDIPF